MSDNVAIYDPIAAQEGIRFTLAAIDHIKKEILKHQAKGLRLGVKKAGCSGLKYVVDYVFESKSNDEVTLVDKDVALYVDAESKPILDGILVDYVREGLNGILKIINPKEKSSCGCGESFTV